MSDRTNSQPRYFAPGAQGMRVEAPGFPPPDQHVVEPETYQEMLDGQVRDLAPADPPHADQQFDLAYVLRAHVADGYVGSTELLTRVSEHNDFATDACIRKTGHDDQGHRFLEELSFEVKHKQSDASLKKRAQYLIDRGVRRVFAIYVYVKDDLVTAGPVKEWSAKHNRWLLLPGDSHIEDPCLRRPVKVRALLDALEADNAVVRALCDKDNPVVLELKAESYDEGKSDEFRRVIRAFCQAFDVELTSEQYARLETLDADELQAALKHLQQHRSWDR